MSGSRCISNDILYNDNFISLPASAKILYVYINSQTDDKGFIDTMASTMRMVSARQPDLKALIDRKYIIKINDWLYLEKHFFLNNKGLRKERLKSRYEEYLEPYEVKDNGVYTLRTNVSQMSDNCQKNVSITKHNITKHNLTQHNITKDKDFNTAFYDRLIQNETTV